MKGRHTFSKPVLTAIQKDKILGIRAGKEPHRFIGIWAVVVNGRVFVRSWNDKADGWRQVLIEDPRGAIHVQGREIRVRARKTRGEGLLSRIDEAYLEKYHTPASRKWANGLNRGRRRMTTMELLPS